MKNNEPCPDQGDLGWLSLNPQAGHEQAGRRPVICLSPKTYNEKSGLAVFCPITSKIKEYPFEVEIPDGCKFSGVVLADQLRSLDWRERDFDPVEVATTELLDSVSALAVALIKS